MVRDNVGSWFAIGVIGSILVSLAIAVLPWITGPVPELQTYILILTVVGLVFLLIMLLAIAGFMNQVVRYLRDIRDRGDLYR